MQLHLTNPLFWLIATPLIASPLIYLIGRIGQMRQVRFLQASPRWLAFLILVVDWVFLIALISRVIRSGPVSDQVESILMQVDGLSLLLATVVLGLGSLVALFSGAYMSGEIGEEKYYAMLVAMIGVMLGLGCAGDLFNLWVWFEAMAVSSYLLVMFYREQPASLEAGVKYVVQSATGSVLILLGIALVLAKTGTMRLDQIFTAVQPSPAILAAGALFIVGFGVKTALVPMHTWLPDAHTQAPSGISAMLSGVVIEAGLVAMLRSLGALSGAWQASSTPGATWSGLFIALGALNMLVGNLMALRQKQVKRILAYSSLSHIGYILFGIGVALYSGQLVGAQGGMFHLLNHGLMKGLAFLAAGALLYGINHFATQSETQVDSQHATLTVADLDGAAQRYPWVALTLSLALLGLGGLPPLAGFMSKWQIFVAGFATHNFWIAALVIFAALNSVLSLGYYAPLVNAVYRKQPSPGVQHGAPIPLSMSVPLAILALAIILLGFWPGLIQWLTAPAGSALLAAFGS
ncbi:MAG: proton-conducting transporter membrane subunit [Chloroflexota bacterium]